MHLLKSACMTAKKVWEKALGQHKARERRGSISLPIIAFSYCYISSLVVTRNTNVAKALVAFIVET